MLRYHKKTYMSDVGLWQQTADMQYIMMLCGISDVGPRQWEADSVGQTAGEVTQHWPPCPHLLPDGAHVGHPG